MATKKEPTAEANGTSAAAPGVLTLAEAAAFLRVSDEGLRSDAESGHIPARKVAGQWRFVKATLLEWLSQAEPNGKLVRTGADLVEYLRRVHATSDYRETVDETEAFIDKIYADRKANSLGGSKHP